MAKRKPLTEEESAAARRLKAIWERKKDALGMTQEKAAVVFGYETQGAISHYLNAGTPLNLPSLILFSRLLKVSANEIYPELAEKYLNDYVDFLDETEKVIVQTTRKMTVEKRAEAQRKIYSIAQPAEGTNGKQ